MIHSRRFPIKNILMWGSILAARGAVWGAVVALLYAFLDLGFLRIPFLPIATVGTAVAFYVGFKNNSSYERFWEGRKIWGGVVNSSRTWANLVINYVRPGDESDEAHALRRSLIYRHIAWINAVRLQLRKTSRFFNKPAASTKKRLEEHGDHMRNDWDTEISPFILDEDEFTWVSARKNPATHIVRKQGEVIARELRDKKIDLFHQIDMMKLLEELYTLQGKCERIKNTPFPRQYAEFSRLFTRVFVFLVPFGLLDVFGKHLENAEHGLDFALAFVPMIFSSALITWVFTTMEGLGDASEDPFERSMNDVPMNALCRTIEIDLKEFLDETELPEKEQPIGNILY